MQGKGIAIEEIKQIRNEAQENIKTLNDALIDMENHLTNVRFLNQACTYDFKSSLFLLNILFYSLISFAMLTLFVLTLAKIFYSCDSEEEASEAPTKSPPCASNAREILVLISAEGLAMISSISSLGCYYVGKKMIAKLVPSNERKMLKSLSSDLNLLLHVLKDKNGEAINLSSNKQAQFEQACQQLASACEGLNEFCDLKKVQAALRDIESALDTILGVINTTTHYQELFQINRRYDQAKKASKGMDLEQGNLCFYGASALVAETKPLLLEES